ncbi:hypothetical protein HELRODRAFT_162203 [Helobdella robusta]|uniref:G-protein coupled receptors family 1 profile domain-containing protein n=1 Tax=Helobdella robusta TaxID=6412 RepID=T1ESC8_HELRO|nr:hypothetical protein HELRODRAFT_162203 [Helobdella robusta]ESN98751.1 hypothetical protein HELRODRAFT_162203 [Helobdella robusta]
MSEVKEAADSSMLVEKNFLRKLLSDDYDLIETAKIIQRTDALPPIEVISNSFQAASIWITVLLAINRYIAVCRPLKANMVSSKVVKMQIAGVFLFSLLSNLPRWFFVSVKMSKNQTTSYSTNCNTLSTTSSTTATAATLLSSADDGFLDGDGDVSYEDYQNQQQLQQQQQQQHQQQHQQHYQPQSVSFLYFYNSSTFNNVTNTTTASFMTSDNVGHISFIYEVVYTIFVLVTPLIILIGLNCKLVKELRKLKMRLQNFSRNYKGSNEANITVVMIAIVMIMVICHTPDRILQMSRFIGKFTKVAPNSSPHNPGSFPHCPTIFITFANITNLLIIISFSINFVIYFVFRQRFRQILKHRMRYLCIKKTNDPKTFIYQNTSYLHQTHRFNMTSTNRNSPNNISAHSVNLNSPLNITAHTSSAQEDTKLNNHFKSIIKHSHSDSAGRHPSRYIMTFRTASIHNPQSV